MNVPAQSRPPGTGLMRQNWRRLLFLHWAMDPAIVQATLPTGLEAHTWEEKAWVAVVPFAMERIRPPGCPPLPGVSDFLELNVRTYVRDSKGRTGVWFYSLDCSQPLAVWGARTFYGLPYHCAEMTEDVGLARIEYTCRRSGKPRSAFFRYRGSGKLKTSKLGSLEEFLLERYVLLSRYLGKFHTARVWHEPYTFRSAEVEAWSAIPLQLAGIDVGERPPDHAVFSPGVDVRVFPLTD